MMISPVGKNKKGFTLIELMVSVAILSIGLVLILQGFAHCLNILRISEDNLNATLMAENKMAEVEIMAKEEDGTWKHGLKDEFQSGNIRYRWKLEADSVELEFESYENLFEVRTTLFWEEGKRKGAIPLVTYMRTQ